MRGLSWHAEAWSEYLALQKEKSLLKKTNQLIKDIQ